MAAGPWYDGAPVGGIGTADVGADDFWEDGAPFATLLEDAGPTALNLAVVDTVTVADGTITSPIYTVRAESISVVDEGLPEPLAGRKVNDAIHVTDVVTRRLMGPLKVTRSESITVRELPIRLFKTPSRKVRTEVTYVSEYVRVQLQVNGGLWVRVAETISVDENDFYLGYQPIPLGPGTPDLTKVGVGPNPGVPAAGLGADYWTNGV